MRFPFFLTLIIIGLSQLSWGAGIQVLDRSAERLALKWSQDDYRKLKDRIRDATREIDVFAFLAETADELDLKIYLEGRTALALAAAVRRQILLEQERPQEFSRSPLRFNEVFDTKLPIEWVVESGLGRMPSEKVYQRLLMLIDHRGFGPQVHGQGPWYHHETRRVSQRRRGILATLHRPMSGPPVHIGGVVRFSLLGRYLEQFPASNLHDGLIQLSTEIGGAFIGDARELLARRISKEIKRDPLKLISEAERRLIRQSQTSKLFLDAIGEGEATLRRGDGVERMRNRFKHSYIQDFPTGLELGLRFLEGPVAYGFNLGTESLNLISSEVRRAKPVNPKTPSAGDSFLVELLQNFTARSEFQSRTSRLLREVGLSSKLAGIEILDPALSESLERFDGRRSDESLDFELQKGVNGEPDFLRFSFDYDVDQENRRRRQNREVITLLVSLGVQDIFWKPLKGFRVPESVLNGSQPLSARSYGKIRLLQSSIFYQLRHLDRPNLSRPALRFKEGLKKALRLLPADQASAEELFQIAFDWVQSTDLSEETSVGMLDALLNAASARLEPAIFELAIRQGGPEVREYISEVLAAEVFEGPRWDRLREAVTIASETQRGEWLDEHAQLIVEDRVFAKRIERCEKTLN